MADRVRDFALAVGHAWRCYECRDSLFNAPEKAWIGYKMTEDERERALNLTNDSFLTVMALAEATGLTVNELEAAIDHPRARLRHLGVYKGEYNSVER